MSRIDLREISLRESERVEWKDQVADISDVVACIVAFSNDFSNLGGGYVVCGAREIKDEHGFQKVEFTGLSSDRFREIENKALDVCAKKVAPPIVPMVEEIPIDNANRRVLVFIIPATGYAHSYRRDSKDASTYYVRISRKTIEARNGILRELLTRKKVLEPWDHRANSQASVADINLITLREYLQEMGLWEPSKSLEDYVSDTIQLSSFVPPLAARNPLNRELHPRNVTLLLFCQTPTRFYSGAYTVFSVYKGIDRSEPTAERREITGTVVEQIQKMIDLLNAEAYIAYDKTSQRPNQAKYPVRALKEAVVNALVHRDYELNHPIRVTVFSDKIEIVSPGGLPSAVDPIKFREGKASPFWRNQSLAYFTNKLQLSQSEGQGIPTILKVMREEGNPEPTFDITAEQVICVLPAHPRHRLMRRLGEIEDMIILHKHAEAKAGLDELLADDPYNFRTLELYCEACIALHSIESIYTLFERFQVDMTRINPGTRIVIAEALLTESHNKTFVTFAERLMAQAYQGKIEESEIKKIAVNLRKIGSNERAIEFIKDMMCRYPHLQRNPSLLELRAKSNIDIAKVCMNTGRNWHASPQIRGKAWDQCREYLDRAERDLAAASETVMSPWERQYIEDDYQFLNRMKEIAKKPIPRRSTR